MVTDQKPIDDLSREALEEFCKKNLRELHEWHREAKELKQQNQKLREALKEVAGKKCRPVIKRIAQQTLDEVNNND